ncbi:lipopolysaccharide biosynthesis protein [Vagococcus fluvialis]|uniref:lipopolysaccharide biosynthesis protein n=1 Tax=Vagococcus fluvialis TaxID=2738 RepID=UPI0037D7BE85
MKETIKKINQGFILIKHGQYDVSTEEGRNNERLRRMMLASIMAMIYKLISVLTPIITIRVSFNYLGQEVYGLWNTVTSFFTMFVFADLGLGNGLQTQLSQASGLEDSKNISRKIISSAYLMLFIVSMCFLVIFIGIFPFVDWSKLMNANNKRIISLTSKIVLAIVIPRILNIPFSLVQRTQLALQDGFNSYVWQSIGSLVSLLSIYIVAWLDLGSIFLIWVSSLATVIVSIINMIVYFNFKKKELAPKFMYVDTKITKQLLQTGVGFLILSILTTLGLALDNFIVATKISLDEAAVYSILYKMIHMISMMTTMITALLWGANGEAMARGDFKWVKNIAKKVSKISLIVSIVASVFIYFSIDFIIKVILGQQLEFSMYLVIGMCLLEILLSFISPYFMILNAAGIVKFQICLFALHTPISFFLKLYFAERFGAIAIPFVGTMSYLIFIVPWVYYSSIKVLDRKEINKGER